MAVYVVDHSKNQPQYWDLLMRIGEKLVGDMMDRTAKASEWEAMKKLVLGAGGNPDQVSPPVQDAPALGQPEQIPPQRVMLPPLTDDPEAPTSPVPSAITPSSALSSTAPSAPKPTLTQTLTSRSSDVAPPSQMSLLQQLFQQKGVGRHLGGKGALEMAGMLYGAQKGDYDVQQAAAQAKAFKEAQAAWVSQMPSMGDRLGMRNWLAHGLATGLIDKSKIDAPLANFLSPELGMKTEDFGDRMVGVASDSVTGNFGGQVLGPKGYSPDAVLDNQTKLQLEGMRQAGAYRRAAMRGTGGASGASGAAAGPGSVPNFYQDFAENLKVAGDAYGFKNIYEMDPADPRVTMIQDLAYQMTLRKYIIPGDPEGTQRIHDQIQRDLSPILGGKGNGLPPNAPGVPSGEEFKAPPPGKASAGLPLDKNSLKTLWDMATTKHGDKLARTYGKVVPDENAFFALPEKQQRTLLNDILGGDEVYSTFYKDGGAFSSRMPPDPRTRQRGGNMGNSFADAAPPKPVALTQGNAADIARNIVSSAAKTGQTPEQVLKNLEVVTRGRIANPEIVLEEVQKIQKGVQ